MIINILSQFYLLMVSFVFNHDHRNCILGIGIVIYHGPVSDLEGLLSKLTCSSILQLTTVLLITTLSASRLPQSNHYNEKSEPVPVIMHLSMYCPTYHPTGKRRGFDRIWPINMPQIRGIWSIFMDNRGKSTVLWWGHLILVFAPGERQLISYRSNPPPLPMGWYLGQYIDRCITIKLSLAIANLIANL